MLFSSNRVDIQVCVRSKRNIIIKAVAAVGGCTPEVMTVLRAAQKKSLAFSLKLMDKYGAKATAESNPRYWEYDKRLKRHGHLPEDYVIMEGEGGDSESEEEEEEEEEEDEEEEREESELAKRAEKFRYVRIDDKEAYDEAREIHAEIIRVGDELAFYTLRGLEVFFEYYENLHKEPVSEPGTNATLPSPPDSEHDSEPEIEVIDKTIPDKITPEKTIPDEISSDKITPEKTIPDEISSDEISSDEITPEKKDVLPAFINKDIMKNMLKEVELLKKKKSHVSACKVSMLESRIRRYEQEIYETEEKLKNGDENAMSVLATSYEKARDRSYYELVPKACLCDICTDKVYKDDIMPSITMDQEGDDEDTLMNKKIAREGHEFKVNKEKTMQMHMLKKLHVDKWYDLSWNREVIEYCSYHKIEPDNHMIIHEVKKRISGIDFNPCIILAPKQWEFAGHNNWFLPDLTKEMVKKVMFQVTESRMGFSYLRAMDKLPTRIEYIATKKINQQPFTDKRLCDMGWEVRRKRLFYYYYLWFGGFKTPHPHMLETTHSLTLMRIARIKKLSLDIRLFCLMRDQEYLQEMKEDLYRLFFLKEKNWGQKDVLASYYTSSGGYLRQIYLECQILIKEFGDEVRDKIPKAFYWITLKRPRPGKFTSNLTVDRTKIPRYVNYAYWRKQTAARNKNTPLKEIMEGKYDDEADKLWVNEPYFMDPEKLYELHLRGDEKKLMFETNFYRWVGRWRVGKVFDEKYENVIPFKEFEGDNMDDIGKDFQRITMTFHRPKPKPSWLKKKKYHPTEEQIVDEAIVMFDLEKDKVKSIRDLSALQVGYSNLFEEVGFEVDFPVKEVSEREYWKKYHDVERGPLDPTAPVIYYKYTNKGGVEKKVYSINKTNLKILLKTKDFKAVYGSIRYYQKLVEEYRYGRETDGCCYYDDMNIMFGRNHVEKRYHINPLTMDEAIFKEFDNYCIKSGSKKATSDYLDKVADDHIRNMMMIHEGINLNPAIAYECFNYYYLTWHGMQKKFRSPSWEYRKSNKYVDFMNKMANIRNDMARGKNSYLEEVNDSANFVVNMFIKKLKQGKNCFINEYPIKPVYFGPNTSCHIN